MEIDYLYSDEVLSLRVNNSNTPKGRYDRKHIMNTVDGEITRTLRYNELVAKVSDEYKIVEIDINYQYDPFRLAYEFYNDVTLYWVILAYNNLRSFKELTYGMKVRVPSITSIYGVEGIMVNSDELK